MFYEKTLMGAEEGLRVLFSRRLLNQVNKTLYIRKEQEVRRRTEQR